MPVSRVVLFFGLAVLGILAAARHPVGVIVLLANLGMGAATIRSVWESARIAIRPDLPKHRIALQCIAGELSGNALEIGLEPIVIGRNAAAANLVLGATEVSGFHAKIWLDADHQKVWIEDLGSTNGTFVVRSGQKPAAGQWVRLQGRINLAKGDLFCLSSKDTATFRIDEIQ